MLKKSNIYKSYDEIPSIDFNELKSSVTTPNTTDITAQEPISQSAVSLEEIKNEIDDIQQKLAATTAHIYQTSGYVRKTPYNKKIYVPKHLQETHANSLESKDFNIQAKLTRIAQFPLSHFYNAKNPVEVPSANRSINLQKRSADEYGKGKNDYNYFTLNTKDPYPTAFHEVKRNKNKPFPDYFNDLLMWHGDVLNTDKVTVGQWENILKGIRPEAEIPSVNLADLQRELGELNSLFYFNPDEVAYRKIKARKPAKLRKHKMRSNVKLPEYVRTVAVKDDAIAKSNDIIIQGKAKYFHLIKQPDFNPEKYMRVSDLMRDLNKEFYSSTTEYKAKDWAHDIKRNDEFWNNSGMYYI